MAKEEQQKPEKRAKAPEAPPAGMWDSLLRLHISKLANQFTISPALVRFYYNKVREEMRDIDDNVAIWEATTAKLEKLANKNQKTVTKTGTFIVEENNGARDNRAIMEQKNLDDLNRRLEGRPDLVAACLKFLDKAVTRPEYAKLSAELTEDRLERRRERERTKKARYRAKLNGQALG